jgi:hypothetical protein
MRIAERSRAVLADQAGNAAAAASIAARPPALQARRGRSRDGMALGGVSRAAEQSREGAAARSARRLSILASLRGLTLVRQEGNPERGENSPFGADVDDNIPTVTAHAGETL